MDDGAAPGAITGGTFVYRGMAMSLYGGDPASGKWYAQVLNSYHEELPDVQIYNMIIPTAIEFYVPDKYRDLTQSQKAMIDLVYGTLDPSIKKVDAYSELAAHTDEYCLLPHRPPLDGPGRLLRLPGVLRGGGADAQGAERF